jgi:hypothetical protein
MLMLQMLMLQMLMLQMLMLLLLPLFPVDAVEERERRTIVIQNIYYRKFICDYPLINFSSRSMIR